MNKIEKSRIEKQKAMENIKKRIEGAFRNAAVIDIRPDEEPLYKKHSINFVIASSEGRVEGTVTYPV